MLLRRHCPADQHYKIVLEDGVETTEDSNDIDPSQYVSFISPVLLLGYSFFARLRSNLHFSRSLPFPQSNPPFFRPSDRSRPRPFPFLVAPPQHHLQWILHHVRIRVPYIASSCPSPQIITCHVYFPMTMKCLTST